MRRNPRVSFISLGQVVTLSLALLSPLAEAGSPVYANSAEVSCKTGSGKAIAAFPDTCFTPPKDPATPPGVPVPYPNTSMATDSSKGGEKTKTGDRKTKIEESKPVEKREVEDKANKVTARTGKTTFLQYNFDVKLDGKLCKRRLVLPNKHPTAPEHPMPLQQPSAELIQSPQGETAVNCENQLIGTSIIAPTPPSVTFVDARPVEGPIADYASSFEPEVITDGSEDPTETEVAAAMSRIDEYIAQNPEVNGYPHRAVHTVSGVDGSYNFQVMYGTSLINNTYVATFDRDGNLLERPTLTAKGRVQTVIDAYQPEGKGSKFADEERTDIYGNSYIAKVVFANGRGYYLFNEQGQPYMGEIYDTETGNRVGGLWEPRNFPTLAHDITSLERREFVQLARTECPIPCQSVTDVYNAIANEINLTVQRMNQKAAAFEKANAVEQEAQQSYEEAMRDGARENPRNGPEPGTPVSASANEDLRRYEGLRETLQILEQKLVDARAALDACYCPGRAPQPLVTEALWGDPYLAPGPASPACLGAYTELNWETILKPSGSEQQQAAAVSAAAAAAGPLPAECANTPLAAWAVLGSRLGSTLGRDVAIQRQAFAQLACSNQYQYAIGNRWVATSTEGCDVKDLETSQYEIGSLRQSQASSEGGSVAKTIAADNWAVQKIFNTDKPLASNERAFGTATLVAIIDSGIDVLHPALAGRIWANPAEIPGNGIDDDANDLIDDVNGWNFVADTNDVRDTNGHGTLVAGLVAARSTESHAFTGVDPGALLMALKVTDFTGSGNSVDVAAAITYAVNAGARIINLSIGGDTFSAVEQAAIEYAANAGVLVVTASGNQSIDAASFWPAAVPGALTIAATTRDDERAPYSNWGRVVDLAAPGSDVVSLRARYTDPVVFADKKYTPGEYITGQGRQHYRATGTSFAAPLVSGVASRLWSERPALSLDEVRRMLLHNANDLGQPGPDIETGYGLLNADAVLSADPAFFIESRIEGVNAAQRNNQTWLQVLGSADANRFSRATLSIGAGDSPPNWQRVGERLDKPVREGMLFEINVERLRQESRWTLRLDVVHENGKNRVSQFDLVLQ